MWNLQIGRIFVFGWELACVELKNQTIFCVRVFFSILLCVCLCFHHCHTFLNVTLARAREEHHWFSFAFTHESTWWALKMHWNSMWKRVFFSKTKNVWFLLHLTLSFAFCLCFCLLAFDFLFYVFIKFKCFCL